MKNQTYIRPEQNDTDKKPKPRLTGAHTTMPIRDFGMVHRWMQAAKAHDAKAQKGGVSWYLLLLIGFNTGLRIGDICALRVSDIRDSERVRVIAQKTKKQADIKIQRTAQKAISEALRNRRNDDYVFASRVPNRKTGEHTHICRQEAYRIIKAIAAETGYTEHVGCHTMRKTFARNFYDAAGGDLSELQMILNHSSPEVTMRYIGITRDTIDATVDKMKIIV